MMHSNEEGVKRYNQFVTIVLLPPSECFSKLSDSWTDSPVLSLFLPLRFIPMSLALQV